MGAEGIRELLRTLELNSEVEKLRDELDRVGFGSQEQEAGQAPEGTRSLPAVRASSRNG